ncbi:MAG TPA: alpha/beta hydrolase domain-containing protein [Burkholderiales bacterium]|nr:alpha/beta hydrolase domain-containing protein [Burkholderiales bacterium]
MHLLYALLISATLALMAAPAQARLTRLEIVQRELVAGGQSFGATGPYERLAGTAYFEVDPGDPRNAVVFDLDHAPRNGRGKVEFSADMVILKPVDLSKGSGTLFFEVNNRGRKIAFGRIQDTSSEAKLNAPMAPQDFGNGFLLRRGDVLAWVGWGADIAPGDNRLTVNFPLAIEHGLPVTERILTEFSDRNFNGGTPSTLPLSGGSAFKSFPAVSTNQTAAEAELWRADSDSPRPSGPELPRGRLIPADQWAFSACPDGWPGVPSTTDICLKGGFQNRYTYRLIYRATNSPVMGLGYLTSRDFVSFLRHAQKDDAGERNPVAGVHTTLCLGISSSGMYYRDYLYFGFNEDEQGRRVCDGMHIHVPGAQRLFLNYRFAQPNPFTQQHRERYVPDVNFPVTYALTRDPLSGREDGILKRPATDPKVIHTDTSTEYWQFRASLLGADPAGSTDILDPPQVRRYLLSGTQHVWFKGDAPGRGIADRQCEQLGNATHPGVILRALIVDLEQWVRAGTPPPDSRVPRIADATLVAPEQVAFPPIPGVSFARLYNGSGERDFGPRVRGNSGVIDQLEPDVLSTHRLLVPQVDRIGNDVAGVRHPFVEVPVATLTGWNTRTPEFGGDDLCDLLGSMIALKRTRAEALAAHDPRPALDQLYRDHADYVRKVEAAARALVRERLMLEDDVAPLVREADQSDVMN